jgi:hypothetical protein
MNKKIIRLTESDLHRIVKRSVNKILKESLDSNMMMDDKERVFEAFKNLIHAMIWENGYIGGDEYKLNDAENRYLQEHGERDIQMLWNNVQKYVCNTIDSEFEGDDLGQDDFDEEGNYKWDE